MNQSRNNQNNKNFRFRSSTNNSGNNNIPRRNVESSGPEGKVRGTVIQVYEKYLSLARDAHISGDRVLSESCLQHAEHYLRLLNGGRNRDDVDEVYEEYDRFVDLRREAIEGAKLLEQRAAKEINTELPVENNEPVKIIAASPAPTLSTNKNNTVNNKPPVARSENVFRSNRNEPISRSRDAHRYSSVNRSYRGDERKTYQTSDTDDNQRENQRDNQRENQRENQRVNQKLSDHPLRRPKPPINTPPVIEEPVIINNTVPEPVAVVDKTPKLMSKVKRSNTKKNDDLESDVKPKKNTRRGAQSTENL